MSFSCLKDGKKIYSFQYTPAQWLELRAQYNTPRKLDQKIVANKIE